MMVRLVMKMVQMVMMMTTVMMEPLMTIRGRS